MSDTKCSESIVDGECCCNCIHQVRISCHPTNGKGKFDKIKVGQGSILELMGYGCKVCQLFGGDDNKDAIMFMDKKHGMCELHYPKDIKKENEEN